MNYLAAAKERNLDLAELPKTLQKKIKELESLKTEFEKINVPKDKLTPEQLENYYLIEQKIAELDEYLEKRVRLFDPVKYNERIAINKEMAKRKQEKYSKAPKSEATKEVTEVPQVPEVPKEDKSDALDYVSKMIPVQQEEVPAESKEVPQLTQVSQQDVQEQEEDAEYEDYDDEEEEFHKYGDAKPKKVINKGWWLMGAGFFLLTWGAVNVFKERRG